MLFHHFSFSALLPLIILKLSLYPRRCAADVTFRQSCGHGYGLCMPAGAAGQKLPDFQAHLTDLYINLLETVVPQPVSTHDQPVDGVEERAVILPSKDSAEAICCAMTTECMLLKTYNVPFCWDRFTTNYYLLDGSFGSMTSGIYNYSTGGYANLFTGEFHLPDGTGGNIYGSNLALQPNTTTLQLPTPWTSSGVGSAIPATEVGSSASYPTTSPPTSSASGTSAPVATTTSQGDLTQAPSVPSSPSLISNKSARTSGPLSNAAVVMALGVVLSWATRH